MNITSYNSTLLRCGADRALAYDNRFAVRKPAKRYKQWQFCTNL